MGDLSSSRVRIRRKRLIWFWVPWSVLAVFIIAGSAGTWSPYEPGIWAPMLVNPPDVARNVALYVPFGMFGMLALGRSDLRGLARITIVAMIFSLANEALQLYTVDRVASLTDIVSAAVGTSMGASIVALLFNPK